MPNHFIHAVHDRSPGGPRSRRAIAVAVALGCVLGSVFATHAQTPTGERARGATNPTRLGELPAARLPSQIELSLPAGLKMRLVLIRPGTFLMGSPATEPERDDDEALHRVRITRPFYLGKFEVTREQWKAVMGRWHGRFQSSEQLPVDSTSWRDSLMFCHKLTRLSGREVRLPTEAEWEYACRAGTKTPYSFGNRLSPTQANFDATDGGVIGGDTTERTLVVGSFPANRWGLHDMHGNVREWCSDWFAPYDLGPKVVVDPTGPKQVSEQGAEHVLRGGSWDDYERRCRGAYRHGYRAGDREECNGLRVVLEARR